VLELLLIEDGMPRDRLTEQGGKEDGDEEEREALVAQPDPHQLWVAPTIA
jgi:hypothetical protein